MSWQIDRLAGHLMTRFLSRKEKKPERKWRNSSARPGAPAAVEAQLELIRSGGF